MFVHLPEGVPVFTIAVVDDVVSEDAVASITVVNAVVNKSATLINYITSMHQMIKCFYVCCL